MVNNVGFHLKNTIETKRKLLQNKDAAKYYSTADLFWFSWIEDVGRRLVIRTVLNVSIES